MEEKLQELINISQNLTNMVNHNATYQHLLDTSADILDAAIIFLDSHFKVHYASSQILSRRELMTEYLRKDADIDYLNLTDTVKINFNQSEIHIFPIFSPFNENKAFVGIIPYQKQLNAFDILKRQQVLNALGLVNARTDLFNETAFRNQSDFFLNVVQGNLTEKAINQYLTATQIDPKTTYTVAILNFQQKAFDPNDHLFDKRQQVIRWFIEEYHYPVLLFAYQRQFILLIQSQRVSIHKFLHRLYQFMAKQGHTLTTGFSKNALPIKELADMYNQANDALQVTSPSHPIMQFHPKNAKELLQLLPSSESDKFIKNTLGPILEDEELLKTLSTYILSKQNISEVAHLLYVHRNTINYRLKSISKLLQVDITMPDVLADIRLALLLIK